MVKNTLLAAMAILSLNVVAENGYWDYREVCDYEQIVTTKPITNCYYTGNLNIQTPTRSQTKSGDWTVFHTSFSTRDNHVQCSQNITTSTTRWITKLDGNFTSAFYAGPLWLTSQTHTTQQSTSVQVVPGSCRTEQVWVPLCPTCQIP